MKIRPLSDKIIIEKSISESTTKSGIILPDHAREKPQTGRVLAVGSGRITDNGTRILSEVKVNDTVYYSKYAGSEIKIDDKEYIILTENDILAVVNSCHESN